MTGTWVVPPLIVLVSRFGAAKYLTPSWYIALDFKRDKTHKDVFHKADLFLVQKLIGLVSSGQELPDNWK